MFVIHVFSSLCQFLETIIIIFRLEQIKCNFRPSIICAGIQNRILFIILYVIQYEKECLKRIRESENLHMNKICFKMYICISKCMVYKIINKILFWNLTWIIDHLKWTSCVCVQREWKMNKLFGIKCLKSGYSGESSHV